MNDRLKRKCKISIALEKRVFKLTKKMGKFHIHTQILQGNALFSGKIYTNVNVFTRPPVVMVATNLLQTSAKNLQIRKVTLEKCDNENAVQTSRSELSAASLAS